MTANEDFMPALDDQENLPYEPESEPVSQIEDELYQHHRFVVDKGQTSTRLDKFLSDRLAKVSRNKIQDAI